METQSQYRRDKLRRYCVPTHCLPNKPEPTLTFELNGLGPYESTFHDIVKKKIVSPPVTLLKERRNCLGLQTVVQVFQFMVYLYKLSISEFLLFSSECCHNHTCPFHT